MRLGSLGPGPTLSDDQLAWLEHLSTVHSRRELPPALSALLSGESPGSVSREFLDRGDNHLEILWQVYLSLQAQRSDPSLTFDRIMPIDRQIADITTRMEAVEVWEREQEAERYEDALIAPQNHAGPAQAPRLRSGHSTTKWR
jgi:hypothetical protein